MAPAKPSQSAKTHKDVTATVKGVVRDLEKNASQNKQTRAKHLKKRDLKKKASLIASFVFLFFVALLIQRCQIDDLKEEVVDREYDLAAANAKTEYYKKAYEVTLDDMKMLSKSINSEARYDALALKLREEELGYVVTNETVPTYEVHDSSLWYEHRETGAMDVTCLSHSVPVDTIHEQVFVTIEASGSFALYVDAHLVTIEKAFNLILQDGMHELAFVARGGGFTLTKLVLDDIEVPLDSFIADVGEQWGIYDCLDVVHGASLEKPGALRVLINKQ
ncbi:MAG: hypothetical protein OXR66_02350 [Candidatus Woesearchaeota archaeon]|nr:hypothetical protein [Candidatus Woesearchaeota archaeon]